MYLDYYKLREKPFSLSPDPKYIYFSPGHTEALSQMIYSITQDSGFMMLTGEVGLGKTILINSLSLNLPKEYLSARVHFTVFDPKELIRNICKEFGIAFSGNTVADLVMKLQEFLKWRYHIGKKSILIVDEAQNLSRDSLEMIRLLSNVESMREKFFQIILVGQPEFENLLKRNDLRQLRERIALRFKLSPLTRKETGSYIEHRLAVANGRRSVRIFTDDAVNRIYDVSEGIPRRINILCDKALLAGYTVNSRLVDEGIVDNLSNENGDKHVTADDGMTELKSCSSYEQSSSEAGDGTGADGQSNESHYESAIDYNTVKTVFEQCIIDHKLLRMNRLNTKTIILVSFVGFIVVTIVTFCALLLGVKLGFVVLQ